MSVWATAMKNIRSDHERRQTNLCDSVPSTAARTDSQCPKDRIFEEFFQLGEMSGYPFFASLRPGQVRTLLGPSFHGCTDNELSEATQCQDADGMFFWP